VPFSAQKFAFRYFLNIGPVTVSTHWHFPLSTEPQIFSNSKSLPRVTIGFGPTSHKTIKYLHFPSIQKLHNFTINERSQGSHEIPTVHIPGKCFNSSGKLKHIRHYNFLDMCRLLWNAPRVQQYQMCNFKMKMSLKSFQKFQNEL
jgi:hypothetical protein